MHPCFLSLRNYRLFCLFLLLICFAKFAAALFVRNPRPSPSFSSRYHAHPVANTRVFVFAHAPTWGRRGLSYPQLRLVDELMQGGKTAQDIIKDIENLNNMLNRRNTEGSRVVLSTVHQAKVRTEYRLRVTCSTQCIFRWITGREQALLEQARLG